MTLLKTLTILALCFISRVNCILNLLSSSKSKIASLKAEILTLSSSVERGLTETPQDRQRMCELFESLEKCNPRSDTLSSPYLNGTWVLRYTTSDAILGRKKAAFGVFQGGKSKVGEILQSLDTKNLRAENAEVVNYFGLNINRKVSSELTPISPSEVRHEHNGSINFKLKLIN